MFASIEEFNFADYLPKSPAERAADAMLAGKAPTLNTPGYFSPIAYVGTELSDLWASASLAITPESQGESLVNQIYGRDANGNPLTPPNITPAYVAADLPLPAMFVKARDTVTHALDSVQSTFIKYAIIGIAVLIAAGAVYAFAGGYARRLAS